MVFEKATYVYDNLIECREAGKAFPWHLKTKGEHSMSSLKELENLYNLFYEKTGCCLFDPEYDMYFNDYKKAVFDYKRTTKKELDKRRNLCERYLSNELSGIYQMCMSGEVNMI